MTTEDRNFIADYMKWNIKHSEAHVLGTHATFDFYTYNNGFENVFFDCNHAFKCANEIIKRGDWHSFMQYFYDSKKSIDDMLFLSMNGEYFFTRMAEWIRVEINR